MDPTLRYCTQRRDFERRGWTLVERLFLLSTRLMTLVGRDDQEFATTKAMCTDVKLEIFQERNRLAEHRASHGC